MAKTLKPVTLSKGKITKSEDSFTKVTPAKNVVIKKVVPIKKIVKVIKTPTTSHVISKSAEPKSTPVIYEEGDERAASQQAAPQGKTAITSDKIGTPLPVKASSIVNPNSSYEYDYTTIPSSQYLSRGYLPSIGQYGMGGVGYVEELTRPPADEPTYAEQRAWDAFFDGTGPQPESMSPQAAAYYGWTEEERRQYYSATPSWNGPTQGLSWYKKAEIPTEEIVYEEEGGGGSGSSEDEYEDITQGGETGGPGPATWTEQYHVPGAPDWWKGLIPDITSPELEYAMLMNSMIPFLSSEDQMSVAINLSTLYPDVFGMYSAVSANFMNAPTSASETSTARRVNTQTGAIPYLGQQFGQDMTNKMFSQERANEMLATLTTVKNKLNKDMGPGYTYLQNLAGTIKMFGGVNGSTPTRQNMTQFMSAMDTILAATESESLSASGPVAKMITTPFFSAGSVLPVTKNSETGEYTFDSANKSLY